MTTGVLHCNCFSLDSTWRRSGVGPTLEFRSRALARATSCFCPADRGAPPSASAISSPIGFDSTTLAKCARLKAAQMSTSLWRSKGSKLLRMVPVNNTGTCAPPEASRSKPCPPKHRYLWLQQGDQDRGQRCGYSSRTCPLDCPHQALTPCRAPQTARQFECFASCNRVFVCLKIKTITTKKIKNHFMVQPTIFMIATVHA